MRDNAPPGIDRSTTPNTSRVEEEHRIERETKLCPQDIDPDIIIVDWDGPNDPENP